MNPKIFALLAITIVAAASPALMALASGASQAAAHDNHADHPTGSGRAECTFIHPTSLPSHASDKARDALADRSSHCPPSPDKQ